ncbi:unnamed protein product [Ilex paraguariensis]|uniref:Uncharacterized protein n=1 Tax=Ilex paraguariensis TaxID=185542 RepID=A0ABC8SSW0_9AQUA
MLYTEDGILVAEDFCRNSELQFWESGLDLHNQHYIERIKELQCQLDMVKEIVRPGCSEEVLNVALNSISSLVRILSMLSSKQKPHASL